MSLRSIVLTSGSAVIGLVGCNPSQTGSQTQRAGSSTDSWYERPKDSAPFHDGTGVPSEDMFEVSGDHLTSAEEQLKDVPCFGISTERASDLIGFSIEPRIGMSFFLARAVEFNSGTGSFTGTLAGSGLWIHHGSLGETEVPMKRQPLVIRLSAEPEKVYASCSMAK